MTRHQAVLVAAGTLGHLGLAAQRVVDAEPRRFGNGFDGPDDGRVLVDGDRVAGTVGATGGDDVLRVEPRVGAQGQWTGRPGPSDPADQLTDEPGTPTTGALLLLSVHLLDG